MRRARVGLTAALAMAMLGAAGCGGGGAPETAPAPEGQVVDEAGHSATSRDFGDQRAGQVEELMEGRFPGVRILRTAQGGFLVQVRGSTSLSGVNGPLYIIDNTPVDVGPAGLVGLNPADIAKIRVLTDIASTAFYGIRGANGVVLITTKRP